MVACHIALLHSLLMSTDPTRSMSASRDHGFTLIEILVALTIFSIMALLGYKALASVLDSRAAVSEHNQKWRAVELFFSRIERDLSSLTPRSIRNQANLVEPPLYASRALGPNGAQLAFTRTGWSGAEGAAADAQRIGYRLRGQQLQLLIWPALDQAPYSEAVAYTVLEPVESMKLRYLDSAGSWYETWGSATDPKLPKAVELSLTLASGERLTRFLAIP